MEEKVTISEERYTEFIKNTVILNTLVKLLFNNSRKGYSSRNELTFDDVEDIMEAMFPERYADRLKELEEGEKDV